MIDFNNTSCYVTGGDVAPPDIDISQPDNGYLLGLRTLDAFLTMLRADVREQLGDAADAEASEASSPEDAADVASS